MEKPCTLRLKKQHWFQIDGSASDALVISFAAHYVLDLNYSKNVKPILCFLQNELLEIADEKTGSGLRLTFL